MAYGTPFAMYKPEKYGLVAFSEGGICVIEPATAVTKVTNDLGLPLTGHLLRIQFLPLLVEGVAHGLAGQRCSEIVYKSPKLWMQTLMLWLCSSKQYLISNIRISM